MPDHFIAFWNVENLFGPENHPHRIPWIADRMAADLTGWSPQLYQTKIAQLASAIARMNGGAGPDILGVCEVEDGHVLTDLANAVSAAVPGRAYGIVHADNTHDKRGIDTAFLFDAARYTVDPALIFNHFVMRRTGTRDIVQATFRTGAGHDLILMANHWPSRSGGAVESAGFRATAGETLGYWHERIREVVGATAAIIAMGDFNDDPWDGSLRFNANAWREKGDVMRARSARFYNLAWEFTGWEVEDIEGNTRRIDGTLYFKGDGNLFDQILVSRPLLDTSQTPFKVKEGSAGVVTFPDMVAASAGAGPRRFGLPKGDPANVDPTGFSDHFPVALVVEEAP